MLLHTTGKKLIEIICKKLKAEGRQCTDAVILAEIRELSGIELNNIVTFEMKDYKNKKEHATNISKWKCSDCGDITKDIQASFTGNDNEKIPDGGWACKKCKRSRRLLIKKEQ